MKSSKPLLALASVIAMSACNRSPVQEQEKAVEAQRQAEDKIASAQHEAANKVASAEDEAIKARNEANQKAAEAQAKANETIREANQDITKARNELREWSQKKIDEVDNMTDDLKAKAQKAAPKAKLEFEQKLRTVEEKRTALRGELAALDAQTAAGLSQFKERIQVHVDELKERVAELRRSL